MISEKAYAKLNLALSVEGKREDGYHNLEMIVVPLQLADDLTFDIDQDISVVCNMDIEDNAVLKTAKYIQDKYGVKSGAKIYLEKHIPIGSGLGGESADIAATIRGLNQLWHLDLKMKELEEIALALGSDTLFCLYNKTGLVTGRGEHIEFLENPPINDVYLLISEHPISTQKAFANYHKKQGKINFKTLVENYKNKAFKVFFDNAFNDLLETAFLLDKTLENTYKALKKRYKNAYMTGSGSTLFVLDFHEKNIDFEELQTISGRKLIKTALFN